MGAYKLSQVFRCSTSCSPPTPFVAFSPSLFWRNFGHIEVIAKCVQDQRKPRYLWWEGPASSRAIGKKAMPERRNQTEGETRLAFGRRADVGGRSTAIAHIQALSQHFRPSHRGIPAAQTARYLRPRLVSALACAATAIFAYFPEKQQQSKPFRHPYHSVRP